MEYKPTPTLEIENEATLKARVRLFIRQEYLNHPHLSGNKWWKLKYNLEQARKDGHTTLLTFGGAYSNHLYATAAAAYHVGLSSIGIVRGERVLPLNPTLSFAESQGMALHFVPRLVYREKTEATFIKTLHDRFGDFYMIPEGGTNELAVRGCAEWAETLQRETAFDYLCLPVGTGGTMAGMINGLKDKIVLGFSALKDGSFLTEEVKKWTGQKPMAWRIETNYHFGGYGKQTKALMEFIAGFENVHQVPLDPVYTGKMMFGVFDLIQQGAFARKTKILVLHTGGLQGRKSLLPDHRL